MKRGIVVLFCGLLIRISDVGVARWPMCSAENRRPCLLSTSRRMPVSAGLPDINWPQKSPPPGSVTASPSDSRSRL